MFTVASVTTARRHASLAGAVAALALQLSASLASAAPDDVDGSPAADAVSTPAASTSATDADGAKPAAEEAKPTAGDEEPAAGDGSQDSGAKAQAQRLLSEGNQLLRRGSFVAALRRFRAAHALYPSPKLLLNVGTSLKHLGRNAEAAAVYEQYLAHQDAEPARKRQVEQALRKVEALVGRITITLNQPDARIHVDGQLLPVLGRRTTLRVEPGRHTVVAEKPGWRTAVGTVTVGQAEHHSLSLQLDKPGVSDSDGSTQRIVAYSLGGAALAAAGVGGLFGGLFLSQQAEADDHCDARRCDPTGGEAVEEAEKHALVANIAFAASGVAAAAALVVYLTAPSNDEPEPVQTSLRLQGPEVKLVVHW